jgi:TolB protein
MHKLLFLVSTLFLGIASALPAKTNHAQVSADAIPVADAADEIVVQLSTTTPLLPVYMAKWSDDRSAFGPEYSKQLFRTLEFDMQHNGHTLVLEATSERVAQAAKEGSGKTIEASAWRKLNTRYVIKGKIEKKNLHLVCTAVASEGEMLPFDVPLSGQVSQDRQQIHLLADKLHKVIFGTDGIASTRVLYTVKQKAASSQHAVSEVWAADYDGYNAHQVTHEKSYCVTPVFVPPTTGHASGNFFYVSYQMGQPKIFIASLREGRGHRFCHLKGSQLMPAISSKRDLVAFISDAAGNPDLFVQQFNPESGVIGKPRQVFASPRGAQGSPTFNPQGTKLAFVSNKDGTPRIYIVDVAPAADGEPKLKLISKQNRENTSPAWSPDGTKLAYSSVTNGVRQIWMYDFSTGQEQQLTQGPGHKENPSWAPNSFHLMFNSANNDTCELYLVNLNQPKATKITLGQGDKRFPSWEPRSS